jgi:hypothetical protein
MHPAPDQEIGDAGRDPHVDEGGDPALAQGLIESVLGEGEGALGGRVVHIRGEIDRVRTDAQGQLDHGPVEFGQGGIHQERRLGQFGLMLGREREDRREVGNANEIDVIEKTLGMKERITRRIRMQHIDDEANRHLVALGELRETDQERGPDRTETEEYDGRRFRSA